MDRASFHFRNKILDFDCQDDKIAISCFSDGLDVISINRDSLNNIKLVPYKGDKISRTCISCLWLNSTTFAVSDKKNNVQLCSVEEDYRYIKTIKTLYFKEMIILLFKFDGRIYCETISGCIIDISREAEK